MTEREIIGTDYEYEVTALSKDNNGTIVIVKRNDLEDIKDIVTSEEFYVLTGRDFSEAFEEQEPTDDFSPAMRERAYGKLLKGQAYEKLLEELS